MARNPTNILFSPQRRNDAPPAAIDPHGSETILSVGDFSAEKGLAEGAAERELAAWDPRGLLRGWRRPEVHQASSFITSMAVHALLVVLLSMSGLVPTRPSRDGVSLDAALARAEPWSEAAVQVVAPQPSDQQDEEESSLLAAGETDLSANAPLPRPQIVPPWTASDEPRGGPLEFGDAAMNAAADQALSSLSRGGLDGRAADRQGELLGMYGGTEAGQNAVRRGLKWLALHQYPDGGWRFNQHEICQGACRHDGNYRGATASTGLALLAFLGAGETPLRGEHRETVSRGLYFLRARMKMTPEGGDLRDDADMYAHGIATIALCEALAMTKDESLREAAQGAVDFIVQAQHQQGGWRYFPGQPGDTTVTGWQFMALKSAMLARLEVPSTTFSRLDHFLNGVQGEGGATYGYQDGRSRQVTTAIGLLCRMYSGWTPQRRPLARGVAYLDSWGPSSDDMYYNYYATQVMFHFGGYSWPRWNEPMREFLISTQSTEGHEAGSWLFPDRNAAKGGRLYMTALAVMTLEVYYRHLPLYGPQSVGQ